jgi:homoserine O-acetyltransferase
MVDHDGGAREEPMQADGLRAERKSFALGDLRLASGATLPGAVLAYETYGRLAAGGRNAVLVTHGYTSSGHAAGRYAADDPAPGWWDGLIGPGKPLDTERLFVVSSNMLGSSYGSTGPADTDPRTGKPFGPDFPEITLRDIVAAQRRLVEALGIAHLVAVAGQSYGGFQAFQWGIDHPGLMDGLVVVCSAPRGRGAIALEETQARLARDPNWSGGWYYDKGGIAATMAALRFDTLRQYGYWEALAARYPEPRAREAALREMAGTWAREFDGNSLLVLGRAAARFDVEAELHRIRARLLYVLSSTDKLFPPSLAPAVMAKLEAAGVDARHFALESANGHVASSTEPQKWGAALRDFIDGLPAAG